MSQITIINGSTDLVRVAIYKKPVLQPTLDSVAWQIVAPPPGGQTVVPIPEDYQAFAQYSLDLNNPDPTSPGLTVYQTNVVSFNETSARFVISSVSSQDTQASGAVMSQVFTDLVLNEVRMENNFGIGVLSHVQKAGQDIYAPQVLWPGGVRMEDIRTSFYLAVVSQFQYQGGTLVDEETQMTETLILEGSTATVTGSMWKGYSITTT
ncbi:MAG: hypothetical protein JF614_29990 [Acidobacteria bacterium]|nr:hypothetical protein [Acidobacteriota bacterium]